MHLSLGEKGGEIHAAAPMNGKISQFPKKTSEIRSAN